MKRLLLIVFLTGCTQPEVEIAAPMLVNKILLDGRDVQNSTPVEVAVRPEIKVEFSEIPGTAFEATVTLADKNNRSVPLSFQAVGQALVVKPAVDLPGFEKFTFTVHRGLESVKNNVLKNDQRFQFYTTYGTYDQFERIRPEALLDKVQQQTLKYFREFAHPASGMIRERSTSGQTVTTGGTGFGVMALLAGVERQFITRHDALIQVYKILAFLERADTYHGAFSHWYNGESGKTEPFSQRDNGADLVETSLLFMGLLTAAEYLEDPDLSVRIHVLYQKIEWNFFLNGTESLFWHWSPDYGFGMNLKIQGWNEALITYVLAAGSEKFAISKENYTAGWARNGNFQNQRLYYGITLPLGPDTGGPLFLSQYSFLGLDPHSLQDDYVTDYAVQCVNHARINREYCIENPGKFPGYNAASWGLTASDHPGGYAAHSPANDVGVISPAAALTSFPFTPEESMAALEVFYYRMGHRLWGEYGFRDAYSVKDDWYASAYLAINQGPIIIGIENYRSGLLWKNCMKNPVVKKGLAALGFRSP